jgi:spore coat protein A
VQELRGVGPTGIPVAVPDGTRKYKGASADHYTIDINQYTDQLHPDLPPTTLWGYNPANALGVTGTPTQRHLGGIIVAHRGKPVQITFRNNLPTQHILPVDVSLMGADGAQNRTTTHLHGGFVPWISDGGPFSYWDGQGDKGVSFLNNQVLRSGETVPANEAEYYYPNDQSARMLWYHDHAIGITRLNAYAGIASAYIIRDDYEEKVLVKKMGLPDFIEKGGRELPLVFQDKIFQATGDPNFPGSMKTAGSLWYPYIYDPDRWDLADGGVPPAVSCVPEMFGDTMLVNGTAFPKATVDPRRYRLRILNACQARFLNLQLYEDNGTGQPDFTKPGPDFLVIGTEGGFLANPTIVPSGRPLMATVDPATGNRSVDPAAPGGSLLTAPAERWDVIIDFNGLGGKKYILCNDAPAPFPEGDAEYDFPNAAGGGDTSVLMRFEVQFDSASIAADPPLKISPETPLWQGKAKINKPIDQYYPAGMIEGWNTVPAKLKKTKKGSSVTVRQLTLNESSDSFGRLIQMLGTNVATSSNGNFSRPYSDNNGMDPSGLPTETPTAGSMEVWQIVNLTGDAHPIHIHLVNAQLLSRQPFDVDTYLNTPAGSTAKLVLTGQPRGPLSTELGWKETFKMNPGEVTTLIMKFDLPKVPFIVPVSPRTGGFEYVWHCHILEHEEHDMMRPLVVMPK